MGLSWLRSNWLYLILTIVSFNIVLGTFIIKFTETGLTWWDSVYTHFTSFTTVGSNIPIKSIVSRMYVIVDALLGYLFMGTLSAILALKLASVDFQKSREKRHIQKGRSPKAARALAQIEKEAIDVLTDGILSDEQKKEKLQNLTSKARALLSSA